MFDLVATLTLTPRLSKPSLFICRLNYFINQNFVKFRPLDQRESHDPTRLGQGGHVPSRGIRFQDIVLTVRKDERTHARTHGTDNPKTSLRCTCRSRTHNGTNCLCNTCWICLLSLLTRAEKHIFLFHWPADTIQHPRYINWQTWFHPSHRHHHHHHQHHHLHCHPAAGGPAHHACQLYHAVQAATAHEVDLQLSVCSGN